MLYFAFLDFEKAFDRVGEKALWSAIAGFGSKIKSIIYQKSVWCDTAIS